MNFSFIPFNDENVLSHMFGVDTKATQYYSLKLWAFLTQHLRVKLKNKVNVIPHGIGMALGVCRTNHNQYYD